jgi:hypothetical protein
MQFPPPRQTWMLCALAMLCAGCGTTRRTDTTRTATEQLLLSDAIDRSVSRIDFGLLAGKEVYLDNTYLGSAVDKEYVTSTLRQHMLACGCIIKDKKEEAELVVEARAGAIGTDRHDVLFGTPATSVSLGALSPIPGLPSQVPEIALAKRTDQMGVAKIAVFAYERASGVPVWQSGSDVVASKSRDLWVFGTGPFQRGNVYGGTKFAGRDLHVPLINSDDKKPPPVRVARERVFNPGVLARHDEPSVEPSQEPAGEAAAKSAPPANAAESKDETIAASAPAATAPAATPAATAAADVAPKADANSGGSGNLTTPIFAPPRSQFDSVWATTPPAERDAKASTADRRWPAASQTR